MVNIRSKKSKMKTKIVSIVLFIGILIFPRILFGQSNSNLKTTTNQLIINGLFSAYELPIIQKREILKLTDKKTALKINPFAYIASGLLFVYQTIFSEQISANCNYEISCSEYTKQCIGRYGLVKGTFLGLNQLSNCIPDVQEDHCEYVISPQYKITNAVE